MTKINTLTDEQRAQFGRFVDEWTDIGLSTEPADRPRAEAAIRRMYEIAGLTPPKRIIWCGSPLSMALTRAVLLKMPDVRASVRNSVGDSVWASVRNSVGASVRDSVGASVWASVGDSVRASVRDSVGDSVWASVGDSVWGQHETSWLAFYNYFHDVLGLREETQRLDGLWEFARSAGWAIPCRDICFVAERHNQLHRDERGRLHNQVAAALSYPDGFCIHAVHGVRVPAGVIEDPASITLATIHTERNSEVQRVMIERFGWDRYARECDAEIVDHDERWGTLKRRRSDGEDVLFLEVVNGSPEPDGSFRRYVLPVAPGCEPLPDPADPEGELGRPQKLTALNAVASTYGLTGKQYAPLAVRT